MLAVVQNRTCSMRSLTCMHHIWLQRFQALQFSFTGMTAENLRLTLLLLFLYLVHQEHFLAATVSFP